MRVRAALAVAAALGVCAVLPPEASAQYFGQNQVQYRDFNFQVLKTEHFDIYYYPEERAEIEQVARLAERWYARLAKLFEHQIKDRQPLVFYASGADFRQTNVVQGLGEGTGGVTEGLRRRIVLPSAGAFAETSHVLGHELVHAFQYDINSGARQRQGGNFTRLPLWFVEGLAEYLSLGPEDSQTAMWLRDAVQSKKLPTLKDLGNPRFFPYRFGHAFWAYVGGRWGDDKVIGLFREGSRSGDATAAIKKVLELDEKTFSKDWGDSIRKTYAGFLEAKKDPSFYGPLLISKKRGGGELNLGPALSPDGKRLVFLSERDLFSVDLYLADADSGKVIRKLASTATDPHFDSLQFIESAGSWSADGRLFVQSALRKGKGAFFVLDPLTGKRIQEEDFQDLSEIQSPVFAPDGRKVVFSALQGGLLDLWEYDLQTRQRRRLTDDPFAELHPALSPDGTQLAFTTDRFTTRLDTLDFGGYRIGILDLASGKVRELPGYESARNSNPQWSPDGKTLFFLSDVHGATDVYRVDIVTGELRQVTELRTGVYGISPLSPSFSVARASGRIAYSARVNGDHDIYAIDDPAKRTGTERPAAARPPRADAGTAAEAPASAGSAPTAAGVSAPADAELTAIEGSTAVLPPYKRAASRVEQVLEDPVTGLPSAAAPQKTEPYRPTMGLTYVGQPSIGVGMDRFGSYVGGSAAMYFSDMLGNHNLAFALQSFGELRDIAGQVVYTNLTHRFDWGVGAEYIPYVYGGAVSSELTISNGEPVEIDRYLLQRQTSAAAFALGAYPFTRADRFELQGTLRRFGFSQELRTQAYTLDGLFLGEDRQQLDTGLAPIYLGSLTAAFVHDTSVFGATSPILGMRTRLEVSPSVGSVTFYDTLADWRAYFMPVRPVTFALRGLHFGRYGPGADDQRFSSIYLGYPELVRGYDNVNGNECVPTARSQCPLFDRLFGSRMLVANAELRAPLYGLLTRRLAYGPLPVELALFADAGVAWSGGQKPSLFGGNQDFLTSIGAAARVNVFGFLVAEVSYARPLQRPGVGWVWQWSIAPGF